MPRIIETPWENFLKEFISGVKTDLFISTPFFSSIVLRNIIERCSNNVNIKLLLGKVTSETVANGSTDLSGFRDILQTNKKLECKCIENLHAKVLIKNSMTEKPSAIITSSNLTNEGLSKNIEFGVIVEASLAIDMANRLRKYWDHPNAESLDLKKLDNLLKESKKLKRKPIQKTEKYSVGGRVPPQGKDVKDLLMDKSIILTTISKLRKKHGKGYPKKKIDFHIARNLLIKVIDQKLCKRDFENILQIIQYWTGVIRSSNMIQILDNDMPKVNKSFKILLNENIPLSNRIDAMLHGNYKLIGGGIGFISSILFTYDSGNYNIYNKRVLDGLKRIYNSNILNVYNGITYVFFNDMTMKFKELFRLQDMEIDWVLYSLTTTS